MKQIIYPSDFPQENPARANGHIFNVGNPNNEVTVKQLAEMMSEVCELAATRHKYDHFVFIYLLMVMHIPYLGVL